MSQADNVNTSLVLQTWPDEVTEYIELVSESYFELTGKDLGEPDIKVFYVTEDDESPDFPATAGDVMFYQLIWGAAQQEFFENPDTAGVDIYPYPDDCAVVWFNKEGDIYYESETEDLWYEEEDDLIHDFEGPDLLAFAIARLNGES
jgi:hypothetical protein